MIDDPDDLLAACGVSISIEKKGKKAVAVECGQTPPKVKPERFTAWSNLHTFTFAGYVARVTRVTCLCCESLHDQVEGIFIVETHLPSGTRRLTRLAKGGQVPQGKGHAKEVTDVEVEVCGECVGALGFDREVDSHGVPYTLIQGEGRAK